MEKRADEVIASMQAQVAAVQAKVAGLKPITVFDYDSGTAAPFTGPGLAMPTALISLGGGTNIFANLKQTWTSVSWEQVIARKPQCIIINNYGTPTLAQKEKFLETSPITKNLPAVKSRCFLPLDHDQVTPGPRNAGAVVAIAHCSLATGRTWIYGRPHRPASEKGFTMTSDVFDRSLASRPRANSTQRSGCYSIGAVRRCPARTANIQDPLERRELP